MTGIQDLPAELLCVILNHCRPDDFEPAVLACKSFYHAAEHLISQHNSYKRVLSGPALDRAVTGHLAISNPFGFLEWLLTVPRQAQADILRYSNRIILTTPTGWQPSEVPHALQARILDESPQLGAALTRLSRDLVLAHTGDACQFGPSPHFRIDPYPANDINYYCSLPPLDYRLVFLGLFANIESLVLTGACLIHVHTALLHQAWRTNLGSLFWNLKEIYIKEAWYWTHTTIIPFLQLPNLQLLVLDYFNQRTGLFGQRLEQLDPPTGGGEIDEGEDSEKPLSIEKLSFLLAEWQSEEMGHLLARSPRFRSLVWEERSAAQLPGDDPYSEDEYSDEEGQVEVGIPESNATHSEAAVPPSTTLENFPRGLVQTWLLALPQTWPPLMEILTQIVP
jgi:hypothetical protein